MRQPSADQPSTDQPSTDRHRTDQRTSHRAGTGVAALVLALTASLATVGAQPATASPAAAAASTVAVPTAPRMSRPELVASLRRTDPDHVSVRGTVPRRSRAVLEQRRGDGDWARVRRLSPARDGGFSTTVEAAYGAVFYRVLARRGGHLRRSSPVRIRVPRPNGVYAGPVKAAVAPGGEIRLDGRIWPARGEVPVELVRHARRGVRVEATGRSAADGSFSLPTTAPDVRRLRTRRYRVVVPARPGWVRSRSAWSSVRVAPTTGLAVDRTPVSFEIGPEVGAFLDVPVDLVAGQPVTVDASAVTPDRRGHLDVSVLDPSGEPAERARVGAPFYGQGLQPTVSGTYTVRLTVDHEPALVTGLVWVSTPQIVPIEVDGDPADVTGRRRPGQATWLTFDRAEGELFTVGCLALRDCDSGQRLVSVGHSPGELGPVGPTGQDMWNPPRSGAYYLVDTSFVPHQVWLTSADPEPLPDLARPHPLDFSRPGQAHGVTLEVVEGQDYTVSVIDRGLVDPRVEDALDAVPQEFEVAGFGSPAGGFTTWRQRGSMETTFRASSDGWWTIYVDPYGPALGPMEIDVSEVAAPPRP